MLWGHPKPSKSQTKQTRRIRWAIGSWTLQAPKPPQNRKPGVSIKVENRLVGKKWMMVTSWWNSGSQTGNRVFQFSVWVFCLSVALEPLFDSLSVNLETTIYDNEFKTVKLPPKKSSVTPQKHHFEKWFVTVQKNRTINRSILKPLLK